MPIPFRKLLPLVVATILTSGSTLSAAKKAAEKPLDFNRDIRPILSDNCFGCHGPDEKHRKAGLRLDVRENAVEVRKGRQAIKPKDLESSELWKRVTTTDHDDLMPPLESNKKLTSQQLATLKRWILEGAEYKGHWAFEQPKKAPLPKVKNSRWAKNEIDYFILQKLEEHKLKPENEASKEKLIRRVSFDLTGLPPTPAEVDAFLADKKPGAYERLIDRLMASPRYGEHQARYWLDAVRYGDTHGLHLDNERSMWPYRDWVVRAMNDNLPFDQFTIWQIAGDLLPNATRDQKIASGYNRCNVTTSEGGAIDEEFYVRYAVDRTETTAANWMGLTAGCAVCHDHKFDPISQKEFYSLYAFFNNNNEKAMDGNALLTPPTLKLPTEEEQKQLDDLDRQMAENKKEVADTLANIAYQDPGPTTLITVAKVREIVWVEDELPDGAKPLKNDNTADIAWVTSDKEKVFSGQRAIKRTATGLEQNFFENVKSPLIVGRTDRLFAYVYIDPANPPKAIMLQFHSAAGWEHRANWGDEDIIPWGEKNTKQKQLMGPLPKAGEWVRLEVRSDKVGMKEGMRINGLAFTQHGGTVYWDKAGVVTALEQKDRSAESQIAWELHSRAEDGVGLPSEVTRILKQKNTRVKATDAELKTLRDYYIENVYAGTKGKLEPIRAKLKPLQDKRNEVENKIAATLIWQEMEKPRGAFVLKRGEYDQRGEEVQPGVPKFLPPLPAGEKTNRLNFAQWLVARNHPLTSRVIVNRQWQQFFGLGFTKTAQDFGSQGEWPSHPELLDWLSVHFIDIGWDVKKFQKFLLMSAAYRQDSRVTPEKYESDPENRLLSRGPRFRLDAEMIRDNALYVSGLLREIRGGKGDRPYQPEGIWEAVGYTGSNTYKYKQDQGDALYRRSLYIFWKRTAPPPMLTTFDAPSREKYCVRRERTDTPLQALTTMNDIAYVEAARHLGERMMKETNDPQHRLEYGFRLVTARRPTSTEKTILKNALQKHLLKYKADSEAAQKLISVGDSPVNKDLNPSEFAAYTMVANLLLNMDEVVNKN